ncbi:pheophytinase, chloroplastic isoform X2 [Ziziphus jujuba]|uniref:Pheophytinase, chloroplastic isoform X2 n=1 Tax=Ziziphus jujuba TaxID=326968 RepID=A0ABM3IF14_ZIZJJ|nr:pheophytinase, chloroplastic isoform X2 [Ziziphus jujuba]
MAITNSATLPFSRLDYPFLSSQRTNKIVPLPVPLVFSNNHPHHQISLSRKRICEISGLKSGGFVSFSGLSDQIEEESLTSNRTSSNDKHSDLQVHTSDHWRKNIPVLAKSHRVYSIDLIGYGYSDKPNPRQFGDGLFYTFETWASQLNDFCNDVVKDDAFFICNSIGGLVGLQAAVMEPKICKGIMLLNISLRMLHIKKQPWYGRPLIKSFQSLLRNTAIGQYFFKSVATPESVRSILCQCYHDTSQVTEELVEKILLPGLEPGAADVFLEFICYSDGPLPEELLPQVKCPVLIAWGDKDPWEPIELGRAYKNFDSVEDFVVLPNVGHCPQDEAPNLVNPLVESFVARHAVPSAEVTIASSS